MLPLTERKEMAKTYPRVRFHVKPTACTAFASSRTSVGTYYHPDPEVRKAKQDKARCRNTANWRFTALKKSWAKDGDFCWSHLIHDGLMGDMTEMDAFERWWVRKYGEGEK